MKKSFFKSACEFYIKHISLVASLFVIIPVSGWIIWSIVFYEEFRLVYYLRIFLSLSMGIPLSIYLNQLGLKLWLLKHFYGKGAGILDGMVIGGSIGMGIDLLPTLTSLIMTNDLELAKSFVIGSLIITALFGIAAGGILAVFGKNYLDDKKILESV
jgi:hypothetical protein